MTPEDLDKDKEKIERSAKDKFEKLSASIKQEFHRYMEEDEKGKAWILLYHLDFTDQEAARFILFVEDLLNN